MHKLHFYWYNHKNKLHYILHNFQFQPSNHCSTIYSLPIQYTYHFRLSELYLFRIHLMQMLIILLTLFELSFYSYNFLRPLLLFYKQIYLSICPFINCITSSIPAASNSFRNSFHVVSKSPFKNFPFNSAL